MRGTSNHPWRALLGTAAVATMLSVPVAARASDGAEALRGTHQRLAGALANSPFGQPLHIASREAGDLLQGEVHAVLEYPFEHVREALRQPPSWCDVLILPFNTKYCHAVQSAQGPGLLVRIGRRYDQPLQDSYKLLFDYQGVASTPTYFESRLSAPEGPVGTRNYRIVMSAIPLEDGRTFMRLSYAYGYGLTGRLAMQAYLATAGADKVGFTRLDDGTVIGGMRGAVERNAMRYYLAIDAFLDSLRAAPAQRAERRVQAWFDATERYPRQLREMDRGTYVAMKRGEIERQRELIQ